MMDGYRSKNILEEEDSVLNSSTEIFYYYRQTLEVFSEYSKKEPLVELSKLFGKWLRSYSDLLMAKLPK